MITLATTTLTPRKATFSGLSLFHSPSLLGHHPVSSTVVTAVGWIPQLEVHTTINMLHLHSLSFDSQVRILFLALLMEDWEWVWGRRAGIIHGFYLHRLLARWVGGMVWIFGISLSCDSAERNSLLGSVRLLTSASPAASSTTTMDSPLLHVRVMPLMAFQFPVVI